MILIKVLSQHFNPNSSISEITMQKKLETILNDRANTGLKFTEEGINSKISAHTVREANSDVRVALKSLFYWATKGEESIEQCFENARRDIYVDLIADLSDTNLLILKAASQIADKFAKKGTHELCWTSKKKSGASMLLCSFL